MTKEEEILLRELAGGRCTIQKVTAAIGPMSLWSKAGLEAEIRKAVEAEREACAKIAEEESTRDLPDEMPKGKHLKTAIAQIVCGVCIADAIRARSKHD